MIRPDIAVIDLWSGLLHYINQLAVQNENNVQKVQGGIHTALIIKILFYTRSLLRFRARAAPEVDNSPLDVESSMEAPFRIINVLPNTTSQSVTHFRELKRVYEINILQVQKVFKPQSARIIVQKHKRSGLQQLC
ncbi:Hypothetical_protein [Hexamita inflata]|uniref:Hypothetical_protein n=1 Tax=Hexamita inflata TaxID=28002 RepID=A0AA86R3P3_9EUKA|nr:Hypothetical protein HINF_LOCUS53167 [Hexamita inflata]